MTSALERVSSSISSGVKVMSPRARPQSTSTKAPRRLHPSSPPRAFAVAVSRGLTLVRPSGEMTVSPAVRQMVAPSRSSSVSSPESSSRREGVGSSASAVKIASWAPSRSNRSRILVCSAVRPVAPPRSDDSALPSQISLKLIVESSSATATNSTVHVVDCAFEGGER